MPSAKPGEEAPISPTPGVNEPVADPDLDLLAELRGGGHGEESFRCLFERYHRRVMRFFSRKGFSLEVCHDLTQETFFCVYKGIEGFRGDVPLSGWIFQIALNVFRNELRRAKADKRSGEETSLDQAVARQPVSFADLESTSRTAKPLSHVLQKEQLDALREALSRLPAQMRRCVQLHVYQDFKLREIAPLMKISEQTVKAHLYQARKRLRIELAGYFDEAGF